MEKQNFPGVFNEIQGCKFALNLEFSQAEGFCHMDIGGSRSASLG